MSWKLRIKTADHRRASSSKISTPDDIASDEPLFVEGLGLDSIDALELGVALRKTFGLTIETVTDDRQAPFQNRSDALAQFVRSQQKDIERHVA